MGDCGDSPDNCSNSQSGSSDGLATGGVRGYCEVRIRREKRAVVGVEYSQGV